MGDRLIQAKWAAKGQDPLANTDGVTVPQSGGNQHSFVPFEFQKGNIRLGVGPNPAGTDDASIGQVDGDLFGGDIRDDMVIREGEKAGLAGQPNDYPGT